MAVIRAAITQTTWTGDKESMIKKHEEFARSAAADGAQVICFQELFYGPYFGITQDKKYYEFAEPADGPVVQRFSALARELHLVMILPIYEEAMPGVYYNTAVVVDSDGSVVGKYRKNHIPNLDKFWEKFYFRPGNLGWPVFQTSIGKVGVTICYDRHFPELADARPGRRRDRVQPQRLQTRPVEPALGAGADRRGRRQRVLRAGAEPGRPGEQRVRRRGGRLLRHLVRGDPQGNYVGEVGSSTEEQVLIRDLELDKIREVRDDWQFYRDRRPDAYGLIVEP